MTPHETSLAERPSALRTLVLSPYAHMVFCTFSWATNVLLARAIHDQTSPMALLFLRWSCAAVVLLLCTAPRMRAAWPQLLKHWKYVAVTGFFGIFLFHATSYQALDATTALNVGFINSVAPIVIVAMSWAVLGERLSPQQWVGVLLSIVGVLTIVVRGNPAVLMGLAFNRGDLWSAGGMPAWGLFTILLYRRPAGLDPLAFVGAIVCVGTLLLLPWFLAEPLWDDSMVYSPLTLGAAVYIGVVPSALANVLWNRAVPLVGANTSGLFLHLIPAFTTLMAILFLGELPRWFHGVAIVLIVTGIWLTTTGRRPPAAPAPAE